MVMPPKKPIEYNGEQLDFFDRLVEDVAAVFEKHRIILDFSGYDELKDRSQEMPEHPEKILELALAYHAWEDYFIECLGVTQKLLLDSETTEKEIRAIISIAKDPTKAATGDRLADASTEVVDARREKNAFLSFHDFLKNKVKSSQDGYYMWKKIYELQVQATLYRPKQEPSTGMVRPPYTSQSVRG